MEKVSVENNKRLIPFKICAKIFSWNTKNRYELVSKIENTCVVITEITLSDYTSWKKQHREDQVTLFI